MFNKLHKNINAFALRILAAVGSALLAFSLAATIEVGLVSDFYLSLTIILGVSILIRYGLERSIVRFVGSLSENEERLSIGQFRLLTQNAKLITKRWLLLALISMPFSSIISSKLNTSFVIIILSVLILSLSMLISGFYRGVYRPTISMLFDLGITSLFSSGILFLLSYLGVNLTLNYIFSIIALVNTLLVIGFILINKTKLILSNETKHVPSTPSEDVFSAQLSTTNAFMVMTAVVFLQNIVIALVLELSVNSVDLALFKISEKIALTIGFFQSVIIAIYAPYFAKNAKEQDKRKIVKTYRHSLIMGGFFALPAFFLILTYSNEILGLFGEQYGEATNILIILSLAQLFNVLFGQSGLALNMSGKEKITRNIIIFSSLISLPISYILCENYGGLGASFSILISTLIFNVLSFSFFFKYHIYSKKS